MGVGGGVYGGGARVGMRARVRIMVSWLPALSVTLIESSRYEPLATRMFGP